MISGLGLRSVWRSAGWEGGEAGEGGFEDVAGGFGGFYCGQLREVDSLGNSL